MKIDKFHIIAWEEVCGFAEKGDLQPLKGTSSKKL